MEGIPRSQDDLSGLEHTVPYGQTEYVAVKVSTESGDKPTQDGVDNGSEPDKIQVSSSPDHELIVQDDVQDKQHTEDRKHPNQNVVGDNVMVRTPGGTDTYASLSSEGYLPTPSYRSLSARRAPGNGPPFPTQSSSGSLHALSEHEGQDWTQPLRRTLSTRSTQGRVRGRSVSQSQATSVSQPNSKRPSYSDHLVYPDQSYASLSGSGATTRPHPVLRTRSSHPAPNKHYDDISKMSKGTPNPGRRTADNTPMSSPGLFNPTGRSSAQDNRSASPQLHHLQTPKETHTADIEHDTFSGNKFINNYEVLAELGRGEHGKVKLGRDMEKDVMVAIKIVPRNSARRRLGKLGAPEDRTKREVAILKKARHPHVVSLLEVIDDPNKNKVYLCLEYVDKGEIKWRKHGVKEVLAINNMRFNAEKAGAQLGVEPTDRELHIARQAQIRHDRLEHAKAQNRGHQYVPNWSLEYAGDTDDESELVDMSRTISRQYTNQSTPSRGNSQDDYVLGHDTSLSGSMYGPYVPDAYRARKFSVAASAISHMSSEPAFDQDDDQRSYVPALTLEEARTGFRDTLLGLEFLHSVGIIHRDIKPANLLMSSTGAVKISDFGVSYLGRPTTEEEADNKVSESEATPLDDDRELARSVGTPAFWAPELCYEDPSMFVDGKDPKVTGALDLWALGITLYCMIYAKLPFYYDEQMGLHEAVCTSEPFCPRTRLVPVDTTSSEPVSRPSHPINGNKRLDYELKFEQVPDPVRDLITKLLIKDPAKRITIADAKRHPWVLEGVTNQSEWLRGPENEREGKKKILEPNERELSHAVVKRSMFERALNVAGRVAASLVGRKDTRKRASTSVGSAGSSSESLVSPAGSSTSTVGKSTNSREVRRTSLRGDEFVQALKASRDNAEHHPLAQSQTASPEVKENDFSYFGTSAKPMSAGPTPAAEDYSPDERRPRGPERAISALSTAESVKTVRASQYQRNIGSELPSTMESFLTPEPSLRARVEGLWEGTTKTLNRLTSRDRRGLPRSRSTSRPSSETDGHADASLAVSNTYAAGAIATPNALKAADKSPTIDTQVTSSPYQTSPQYDVSVPSITSTTSSEKTEHVLDPNLQDEQSTNIKKSDMSLTLNPSDPVGESSDDTHEQSDSFSAQVSPLTADGSMQTAASQSTIASSLDAFDNSSVCASISNPSFVNTSGASSPPDGFISAEYKHLQFCEPTLHTSEADPEIMRTADTVTLHGRPEPAVATGKPLQQEHEYYGDDDDDDESSDEDGIVMGGPRRV